MRAVVVHTQKEFHCVVASHRGAARPGSRPAAHVPTSPWPTFPSPTRQSKAPTSSPRSRKLALCDSFVGVRHRVFLCLTDWFPFRPNAIAVLQYRGPRCVSLNQVDADRKNKRWGRRCYHSVVPWGGYLTYTYIIHKPADRLQSTGARWWCAAV